MLMVFMVILAYLLGSISSAVVTCRLFRLPDPRQTGSGNPGATNVLRVGGKLPAVITLLGDALKGVIPILLAKALSLNALGLALVALAAFLGHLYPIFFRFKGGKGVATLFGVLIALAWPLGLTVVATWLCIALLFRYSSLAALVTALSAPFYTWYYTNPTYTIVVTLMCLVLIYRHRQNIRLLWQGREGKIGQKKIKVRKAANEEIRG